MKEAPRAHCGAERLLAGMAVAPGGVEAGGQPGLLSAPAAAQAPGILVLMVHQALPLETPDHCVDRGALLSERGERAGAELLGLAARGDDLAPPRDAHDGGVERLVFGRGSAAGRCGEPLSTSGRDVQVHSGGPACGGGRAASRVASASAPAELRQEHLDERN